MRVKDRRSTFLHGALNFKTFQAKQHLAKTEWKNDTCRRYGCDTQILGWINFQASTRETYIASVLSPNIYVYIGSYCTILGPGQTALA